MYTVMSALETGGKTDNRGLTVRKRVNFASLLGVLLDSTQTSECVDSINVHGARSTNTFTT
jgi:hypothetical protein